MITDRQSLCRQASVGSGAAGITGQCPFTSAALPRSARYALNDAAHFSWVEAWSSWSLRSDEARSRA